MQKKLALLSFFILIILLLLAGTWAIFIKEDDLPVGNRTLTEENITLTYEYVGKNLWKYNIKGDLPNPCHSATVEALVAESYPEQVNVTVKITDNSSTDTTCVQVIKELDIDGEFSASPKATVNLQVNKQ